MLHEKAQSNTTIVYILCTPARVHTLSVYVPAEAALVRFGPGFQPRFFSCLSEQPHCHAFLQVYVYSNVDQTNNQTLSL